MAEKSSSIQISIRPGTDQIIADLAEQVGMSKVEMLSRVYEWFASQSEEAQKVILGVIPRSLVGPALGVVVKRMAEDELAGAKFPPEQMQQLQDELEQMFLKIRRASQSIEGPKPQLPRRR